MFSLDTTHWWSRKNDYRRIGIQSLSCIRTTGDLSIKYQSLLDTDSAIYSSVDDVLLRFNLYDKSNLTVGCKINHSVSFFGYNEASVNYLMKIMVKVITKKKIFEMNLKVLWYRSSAQDFVRYDCKGEGYRIIRTMEHTRSEGEPLNYDA